MELTGYSGGLIGMLLILLSTVVSDGVRVRRLLIGRPGLRDEPSRPGS